MVVMPVALNNCDRVLGVLVEVGVEDAHVLEVQARTDVEEIPPQVVQLEGAKASGLAAMVSSMVFPYARTASSRPSFTFAMMEKPWHAGVRG